MDTIRSLRYAGDRRDTRAYKSSQAAIMREVLNNYIDPLLFIRENHDWVILEISYVTQGIAGRRAGSGLALISPIFGSGMGCIHNAGINGAIMDEI